MEDIIVDHKVIRSTSSNPIQRSGPLVSGENISIGTMIVNSPNARVDNSVRINQSYTNNGSPSALSSIAVTRDNGQDNYNADRDFIKNASKNFDKVVPALMMMYIK